MRSPAANNGSKTTTRRNLLAPNRSASRHGLGRQVRTGKPKIPPTSLELWQRRGLTRREAEVLRWLAIGKTNPEIGIILGISRLTVKTHAAHIFAKLDVETRTAASLRAMELLRDTGASS